MGGGQVEGERKMTTEPTSQSCERQELLSPALVPRGSDHIHSDQSPQPGIEDTNPHRGNGVSSVQVPRS